MFTDFLEGLGLPLAKDRCFHQSCVRCANGVRCNIPVVAQLPDVLQAQISHEEKNASSPVKLSQKHAAEIAAAQKKADDAKKTAKAAKAAYKEARKKFKEVRKIAKAAKKAVKLLKADLAAIDATKTAPRKSAGRARSTPEPIAAPPPTASAEQALSS